MWAIIGSTGLAALAACVADRAGDGSGSTTESATFRKCPCGESWQCTNEGPPGHPILCGCMPDDSNPCPPPPVADVLTQHDDNQRTGWYHPEPNLTPSTVSSLAERFCWLVDGKLFAQPLFVHGLSVNGATKDVLFAATTNNSVYAFDVANPGTMRPGTTTYDCPQVIDAELAGNRIWKTDATTLGAPTTAENVTGGNLPPDDPHAMGILSTPVIDRASGTLFAVARTSLAGNGPCVTPHDTSDMTGENCVFRLFALDLVTGKPKAGRGPVVIAPTWRGGGLDGKHDFALRDMANTQYQRPALLLAGGTVYVAFGSASYDGSCHETHGWIVGYDATTLAQKSVFVSSPKWSGSGIWMGGNGPAADESSASIFFATANGPEPSKLATSCAPDHAIRTRAPDGGVAYLKGPTVDFDAPLTDEDSIVQISASGTGQLASQHHFSPAGFDCRNTNDGDLGSGGVVLVPGTSLLVAGGKDGFLHLLSRATLTELDAKRVGPADSMFPCISAQEIAGAPVVWGMPSGSGSVPVVFVWPNAGTLQAFKVDTAAGKLVPLVPPQPFPSIPLDGTSGALTISSADGTPGTGILWASVRQGGATKFGNGAHRLYAFDATTLAQLRQFDFSDGWSKFTPPTVANGRVYLSSFESVINAAGTGGDGVHYGRIRVLSP